jgi:signal transduction histidine kinase
VEPTGSVDDELPSRRILAVLRAAVAAACLANQLAPGARSPLAVTVMAVLFACYALASLLFRWEGRPGLDLLALVGQTIFFLVFAAFGAGSSPLLSCALYFQLLLTTMLLHSWLDTWIVAAASSGFLAVIRTERTAALLPVVAWLSLLAAAGAVHKWRRMKWYRDQLQQARAQAEQAERVREEERRKLAGDFHDGPLQGFSGLQMRLEVLRRILERKPEAALEELRSVQELVKSQTAEMRAFYRGIRPVEVGRAGLTASLRQVVAEFQKHSGIAATFHSLGSPGCESAQTSSELVQIVREALNNVQKHSKATRVAVTIQSVRNQLEISVEDNGIGFPFSGAYNQDELELLRMGPSSIQTRVRSLGGELVVASHPQTGSSVTVRVPA